MQIFYEGADITADVSLSHASFTDRARGAADALQLTFSDTAALWRIWQPRTGDKISLNMDGQDTRGLWVHRAATLAGMAQLIAITCPPDALTQRTQTWQDVRLMEVAGQIAARYGLSLVNYGVKDQRYALLSQDGQADMAFLQGLGVLEGFSIKINTQQLIMYEDKAVEDTPPLITLRPADFIGGDYEIAEDDLHTCAAVECSSGSIHYRFAVPGGRGRILKLHLHLNSLGEAERFARNLARDACRHHHSGCGTVKLNTGIAAGTTIMLEGFGAHDGAYCIAVAEHQPLRDRVKISFYKPPSF